MSPPPGGGDGGQGVCLSRGPGETRPWCQKGRKDTLSVPRPLGISSLASHQLISTCQRAMSPLARPTLGGFPTWPLDGGGAHGPLRTLALPSTPGRPSPALSPRSTCSPWWWSTSAVSGCLVTSTTGSTSSWPCEQCLRAPSGGSRPSRGHMVRAGEGKEEGPGIMNIARKHHLLPRD